MLSKVARPAGQSLGRIAAPSLSAAAVGRWAPLQQPTPSMSSSARLFSQQWQQEADGEAGKGGGAAAWEAGEHESVDGEEAARAAASAGLNAASDPLAALREEKRSLEKELRHQSSLYAQSVAGMDNAVKATHARVAKLKTTKKKEFLCDMIAAHDALLLCAEALTADDAAHDKAADHEEVRHQFAEGIHLVEASMLKSLAKHGAVQVWYDEHTPVCDKRMEMLVAGAVTPADVSLNVLKTTRHGWEILGDCVVKAKVIAKDE